jgi:PBSX family phage terminase large subunit
MALRDASFPNNRVLIVRKTLASLRKSTLNTLLSILPHRSYEFNKSEGIIKLHNGSEIYLMGCDMEERIKSTEFGCAFIDEGSELTEEEYSVVKFRVRLQAGSRRVYICTNPSSQDHFLYKRFYMDSEQKPLPVNNRICLNKNRMAITASSLENPYLPKDYIEELNTLEGARRERCVNGLWVNMDNMIFDAFDRNIHVKDIEITKEAYEQYDEFVVSIDYGYSHFTGVSVIGLKSNKAYVIDEYYKNRVLLRDIVAQIKEFGKKYPDATYVYDPSAAGLGAELENLDLHVIPGNHDVKAGIDRIRNRLRVLEDGPDLIINSKCNNLIREMENYSYVSGTERPVKVGDDMVDSLRYAINYIDDTKASYIYPQFIEEVADEEEEVFINTGDPFPASAFRDPDSIRQGQF